MDAENAERLRATWRKIGPPSKPVNCWEAATISLMCLKLAGTIGWPWWQVLLPWLVWLLFAPTVYVAAYVAGVLRGAVGEGVDAARRAAAERRARDG